MSNSQYSSRYSLTKWRKYGKIMKNPRNSTPKSIEIHQKLYTDFSGNPDFEQYGTNVCFESCPNRHYIIIISRILFEIMCLLDSDFGVLMWSRRPKLMVNRNLYQKAQCYCFIIENNGKLKIQMLKNFRFSCSGTSRRVRTFLFGIL